MQRAAYRRLVSWFVCRTKPHMRFRIYVAVPDGRRSTPKPDRDSKVEVFRFGEQRQQIGRRGTWPHAALTAVQAIGAPLNCCGRCAITRHHRTPHTACRAPPTMPATFLRRTPAAALGLIVHIATPWVSQQDRHPDRRVLAKLPHGFTAATATLQHSNAHATLSIRNLRLTLPNCLAHQHRGGGSVHRRISAAAPPTRYSSVDTGVRWTFSVHGNTIATDCY